MESGALVPDDDNLEAAELAREASIRRQREEQDAARAVEGAVAVEHQRLRDEAFRREIRDPFFRA